MSDFVLFTFDASIHFSVHGHNIVICTKDIDVCTNTCYNINYNIKRNDIRRTKEVLIKSGMQIVQADFSSGGCRPQDCMKMTQEYLMYFKEFSCKM